MPPAVQICSRRSLHSVMNFPRAGSSSSSINRARTPTPLDPTPQPDLARLGLQNGCTPGTTKGCATGATPLLTSIYLVAGVGFEPTTFGL